MSVKSGLGSVVAFGLGCSMCQMSRCCSLKLSTVPLTASRYALGSSTGGFRPKRWEEGGEGERVEGLEIDVEWGSLRRNEDREGRREGGGKC